ncbi:FepC ABC-type cobalamin/Fe3+-siderophores transport systems, ATPase components [Candidatus Nanopelagicaceae bacterium]|jgi:ABC-type cobalamin/Fe3+-siderophores transport system ATPase subunit
MAMISMRDISIVRNGRTVLSHFSAEIEPGTITAIIGPNGSGKSSLIAAIAGDIALSEGEIYLSGKNLSDLSLIDQAALRSVVIQNRNYWLSFSAQEVIEMGQSKDARERIPSVVEELDMAQYINQSVTTLSGGEAQRVEIARALVRDTEIYLLDEPLASQDSQSKFRIIASLEKLRAEGKTILIIAHLDKNSLAWCDQVIDTLA